MGLPEMFLEKKDFLRIKRNWANATESFLFLFFTQQNKKYHNDTKVEQDFNEKEILFCERNYFLAMNFTTRKYFRNS